MYANAAPEKGRNKYAIKRLAQDIGILGYNRMIIKGDQEPAILELKQCVKRERHEQITLEEVKDVAENVGEQVMTEESPVKESRSNGEIEKAIQTVQEQIRRVKSSVESRYGKHIPKDHASVPWMIRHAPQTLNRYHVSKDGKSACERLKGKRFKREVA